MSFKFISSIQSQSQSQVPHCSKCSSYSWSLLHPNFPGWSIMHFINFHLKREGFFVNNQFFEIHILKFTDNSVVNF